MTTEVAQNDRTSAALLLPIMAAIFGVYVVIGLAMPVLPLYVHQRLGFGPFVVGLSLEANSRRGWFHASGPAITSIAEERSTLWS
jgi:hypothetical protein